GSNQLCADIPGTGKPLELGKAIVTSPDGGSVYVASETGTLSIFSRDGSDRLDYAGCISDDGSNGCADMPGNGKPLKTATAIAISPDSTSVYVLAREPGQLTVFRRDPSGGLSFEGCISDDGSNGCADMPGTGERLKNATALHLTANGRSLYVAS